jgi:hypothetical protein
MAASEGSVESDPFYDNAESSLTASEIQRAQDIRLLVSPPQTLGKGEEERLLEYHLGLLQLGKKHNEQEEVITTPIFTMPVLKHAERVRAPGATPVFSQYGLLAGLTNSIQISSMEDRASFRLVGRDPRIFFNIATPSSTFICGSQGSGKSHTLSCLLENCLMSSDVNKLPHPLTGLVFHYDTFIGDRTGQPCEAAFLASNSKIKVRVLCSPTNIRTIEVFFFLHTLWTLVSE